MNTIDLAGIVLRATLILVGALALATMLRRHAGSTRHALWTVTTLLLLALPLLQGRFAVLPSEWSWLPNPRGMESAVIVPASAGATNDGSLSDAVTHINDALVPLTSAVSSSPGRNAAHLLGGAWLLGLMGFLAPVLLGVVRARRLIRDAVPVDDARLLARFAAVRREVGVRREVHLAMAPNIRTPMTGGIVASVVLLPADAATWSDECVTTVFRHELVHVRRADAIRQLASRLSVALYWFHPLAWRAARHASLAREQACDEAVLRLGARPSQYARHLLHFADAGGLPNAIPAMASIDHPQLEDRVMAILHATPARPSRRLTFASTALLTVWGLGVAAAAPSVAAVSTAEVARVPAVAEVPMESFADASAFAAPMMAADQSIDVADCEMDAEGRVSTRGNGGPARTFTTTHAGMRLCVTVRGDRNEAERFIPRGRLAPGVTMTLASISPEGSRRLVVTGAGNGNQYQWFVDGRERPFNAAADVWQATLTNLVEAKMVQVERDHEVDAVAIADVAPLPIAVPDLEIAARQHAIEAQAVSIQAREAAVVARDVEASAVRAMRELELQAREMDREEAMAVAPRAPYPPPAASSRRAMEARAVELQVRGAARDVENLAVDASRARQELERLAQVREREMLVPRAPQPAAVPASPRAVTAPRAAVRERRPEVADPRVDSLTRALREAVLASGS